MRDVLINATRSHLAGHINKHLANVEVYMNNTVGIGEHSDIMEAIQAELDKMAMHEDRLAILNNWPQEEKIEQESS